MRNKYPACGQVRDVEGRLWDVRDVRNTKHGFDLLFGSLASRLGRWGCGLPALIATQPLVDFWETNRTKHNGMINESGRANNTKRVRSRPGFDYFEDTSEFFLERIEDLMTLSTRAFTIRHKADALLVRETRLKIAGPARARGGLVARGWAARNRSIQYPAAGNGREAGDPDQPSSPAEVSSAPARGRVRVGWGLRGAGGSERNYGWITTAPLDVRSS